MHNIQNKYYFTEREMEVLKYVVKGCSNIEIGNKMFLSYHTIKVHISSILKKLNTTTRIKAVIKVLLEGII